MYRKALPMDAFICLCLSVLVALGTGKIAETAAEKLYADEVEAHKAVDGEIGGRADDTVLRAESIEDMLDNDTFTIVSYGIQYMNEGAGYHNGRYMYNVRLPSGERVAAWINTDSVQHTGDIIYSGDSILPLGRIVWEDLSGDSNFLSQIEHGNSLTRKDFYVDMVGDTAVQNEEQAIDTPKIVTQVLTVLVCFPIFHMLGSKIGLFPPYFSSKKKENTADKN